MQKVTALLVCVLWALILLGCSGFQQMAAEQEQRKQNLQEIGTAYRIYWDKNLDRGPKTAADLEGFLTTPAAKVALTDGSLVVNYGITAREMHELGRTHTVLAYEKDVPNGSGFVLTAIGVQHMAAGTFRQMSQPRRDDR